MPTVDSSQLGSSEELKDNAETGPVEGVRKGTVVVGECADVFPGTKIVEGAGEKDGAGWEGWG